MAGTLIGKFRGAIALAINKHRLFNDHILTGALGQDEQRPTITHNQGWNG